MPQLLTEASSRSSFQLTRLLTEFTWLSPKLQGYKSIVFSLIHYTLFIGMCQGFS